jgi:hypothetical protein
MNHDTLTREELIAARAEPAPNGNGAVSDITADTANRACVVCGGPVTSTAPHARYCGPTCRNRRPRSNGTKRRALGVDHQTVRGDLGRRGGGECSSQSQEIEHVTDEHDGEDSPPGRPLGAVYTGSDHCSTLIGLLLDAGATITFTVDGLELRAMR